MSSNTSKPGRVVAWMFILGLAVAATILVATVHDNKANKAPLPTRVECSKATPKAASFCQVLSTDGVWLISRKGTDLVATKVRGK